MTNPSRLFSSVLPYRTVRRALAPVVSPSSQPAALRSGLLSGLGFGALLLAMGLLGTGCEVGGVGDPCIPEDEYRPDFPGYAKDEVNVESRSFQCETRV